MWELDVKIGRRLTLVTSDGQTTKADRGHRCQRPRAVAGSTSRTELAAVEDSCSPWRQRRAPLVRTTGDEAGDCGEGKTRRPAVQLEDDGGAEDSDSGLI